MIAVYGTIQAYDPATDTVTVEMTEVGALDAWLSGIHLQAGLNRAYCTAGCPCTLQMPDVSRPCEATVVALYPPGTILTGTPSAAVITQSGRVECFSDDAGHAAASVTFPLVFGANPTLSISGDYGTLWTASGITQSGFTVTLSGQVPINSYIGFTWSASG